MKLTCPRATGLSGIVALAATLALLVLPGCTTPQDSRVATTPETRGAGGSIATEPRIVLVEWRIKKGREQEFLTYWATRATVGDRSGLIGEFLSRVEDRTQFPWVVWDLDPNWTTFVNVGLWRSNADFKEQIGRFIDLSRPPLDFEAQGRRRLFVVPERWRIGASPFTASDHPEVR